MANHETPEASHSPEELGHLVKGIDFRSLVEYAKTLDIPGYEAYDNMIGSRQITVDGLPATVGWVAHRTFQSQYHRQNETPMIEVSNSGGETVTLVEGSLSARIARAGDRRRRDIEAMSRNGKPDILQFEGGDTVWLSLPTEQEEPSWYVCFYPEAETPVAD